MYNRYMGSTKYNISLKEKAINLRLKGKSYNEIRKTLGVNSKGTISHWLHGVILTDKAKKLLTKNTEIAYAKGLFKSNNDRRARINLEDKNSLALGESMIKSISKKDLTVLGVALFWGEGTKYEPLNNLSRALTFTNSDPVMISVYMRFLREVIKVPENKIRAGVHLYSSMDRTKTIKFWSKITKLPESIFYVVTQVSSASKGKRKINFLPHGTAVIRVNSRFYFYIVKGMLSGLIKMMVHG